MCAIIVHIDKYSVKNLWQTENFAKLQKRSETPGFPPSQKPKKQADTVICPVRQDDGLSDRNRFQKLSVAETRAGHLGSADNLAVNGNKFRLAGDL